MLFKSFSFNYFLDSQKANESPDTICHIPQKAAKIAIPPKPLKKVNINNNPNPEFCIPVSKVMVFISGFDNLKLLATK